MREFLGKCAWGVAVGAALSLVANVSEANWRRRADLPDPRSKHAAAIVGGKLYVMGGLDENHDLTSEMVRYDPRTDTWAVGPSTILLHQTVPIVTESGVIYALGGLPLGAHVNALSDALEAWDTGIRAVSPGSHTLLTTWSALRSAN